MKHSSLMTQGGVVTIITTSYVYVFTGLTSGRTLLLCGYMVTGSMTGLIIM